MSVTPVNLVIMMKDVANSVAQEVSKILPTNLAPGTVHLCVRADVYGRQVVLLDVRLATLEPPEEPGSKTGQKRVVKIAFDGGNLRDTYVWLANKNDKRWRADSPTVVYNLAHARTAAAKKIFALATELR